MNSNKEEELNNNIFKKDKDKDKDKEYILKELQMLFTLREKICNRKEEIEEDKINLQKHITIYKSNKEEVTNELKRDLQELRALKNKIKSGVYYKKSNNNKKFKNKNNHS